MEAVLNSFEVKESHCPYSLGVQSISKYCNERGHNVRMVSSSPANISKGIEKILSSNPEVIGFSFNYVTEPQVIEMIKRIKQQRGDKTIIVAGGPSVTYSSPKSRIRQSDADLFIRGDGERAFYEILETKGKNRIYGVSSRGDFNEEIASTDLSQLPSVFPLDFQTDHVYWETVRGCAFSCIYCAHPGMRNNFREFSLEKVAEEAEYLRKKGFRAIYITDPILGGKKERSKEILRLLTKLKDSFITAEYRPEYLDEEVMDLLEEAQIGWLEFGLQTTNQDLSYFRKNSPHALEKLEELSKRPIKYSLDLIAGIPGDTRESFEESLRFAVERAKPTSLKVFPLRVYEGTILQKMAESEDSWDYDSETRIIKKSNTFDEEEFSKWMQLGRSTTHLYRFFEKNKWFGDDQGLRRLEIFKSFSDKFGKQIFEEYDESQICKMWGDLKNEK